MVQPGHYQRSKVQYNYWTLTKPEIKFIIGFATAAAFVVGNGEPPLRALSLGAPGTHAPRDSPGCERGRCTESGDRATVRCANEAHISAAAGKLHSPALAFLRDSFSLAIPCIPTAIVWMYREDYARAGSEVLPRGREKALSQNFIDCSGTLSEVTVIWPNPMCPRPARGQGKNVRIVPGVAVASAK